MPEAPLILVVDDEQSYRDALRVALEREGFRVEVAVDGPDALERFVAIYGRGLLNHTRAYDGIPEVLEALSDRASLAVLTNKPLAATRRAAPR